MSQLVYLAGSLGEHYNVARTDMVTLLEDFREQLLADNIVPNITAVFDNHAVRGPGHPYMTVGITTSNMDYLSKGGASYSIRLDIEMQVFLHFNAMDGQYDEREKWALLNSLFNYIKNTATISSNFDAFFLRSIQGNTRFPVTNSEGAIMNFTLVKVTT